MYIFDQALGRRRFIQGVGAAAGAVAVAGSVSACGPTTGPTQHALATGDPKLAAAWGRKAGEWVPSCCNMCGGQSGIMVQVVDGVVNKIEPNPWNPTNYSNISTDFFEGYSKDVGCASGGAICPKGNAGIAQLYDPDRVKTPLKRTNPDKSNGADPKWEKISWAQALDEVSARMRGLRDAGDAHKLLWMSEDGSFTNVQDDFCKLFGSPNYSMHSNLCDVARKASFKTVMGDERPLSDFIQTKYIMLFGWNPTSAIKWVYLPRIITQAVERGAHFVVVDPYMSDTAAKAHEWVSLRPGTDGALALAMAHVIVREGLYDKDFVANWTVGFEGYAKYLTDKTPQWAEKITSVKAATIERLAREVATTKPALVDSWSGPGQHSNGVNGGRAIALLNALIGSWDVPGGMMIANRTAEKHQAVKPDKVAKAGLAKPRFDELKKYPMGHKSGVYAQAFANLLDGTGPYQPEMLMCVFQNPVMSVPGGTRIVEALAKIKTVVVVDTMMSETAMCADYVLPGTTYLERYDLNDQWVTWPVLGLRQPVVKPLFGQLAEYETVAALGRRLGLTSDGKTFFDRGGVSGKPVEDLTAWYEEYLSNELLTGAPKISLDELKALPGAVWISKTGTQYRKYTKALKPDKLATAWYSGDPKAEGTLIYDKPKDDGGAQIGIVLGGKPIRGFFTNSGKVEFESVGLAKKTDANGKKVDTLPVYIPRDWQPSKDFPLYLINWKEASHTHTRTQNNTLLLDIKPTNPLVIHPDTAQKLGIEADSAVWVESPHGKVKAIVKVSPRIHPEVVGLQHGFGHTALGRNAKGRGTADGQLRPVKADPLSGMALHKEACVRVFPV